MKKYLAAIFMGTMIFFGLVYGNQQQNASGNHRLKSVHVIVTKHGEFVENLKKDDFQLFEDGKEVQISSLELATSRKQLSVIFHDPYFWVKNIQNESDNITKELVYLAGQGVEIMIFRLSWQSGLELLQDFTTQERLIREAAAKAMGIIGRDEYLDDLTGQIFYEGEDTKNQVTIELEGRAEMQAFQNIKRIKFEKTVGGLLAACNMMKEAQGRNAILIISAGIPDLSPVFSPDLSYSKQARMLGEIRIFDPFYILKEKKFKNGDDVLREMIQYAGQQDVSVYSLDPGIFTRSLFNQSAEIAHEDEEEIRRTARDESMDQMQNLRLVSEETGAVLFRGANKFKEMRQILNTDLAYSYRLSFTPPRKKADDQYHKLKAKTVRGGMNVRGKKGYVDYSEVEENKMMLISAFYNLELFKGLLFEAEFTPFFKEKGKYEPWINLALPTHELLKEKIAEQAKKMFRLHFWISGRGGSETSFGGQINVSFAVNPSFLNDIQKAMYLLFYFVGKEISLSSSEHQVIFALLDSQKNEIGAWNKYFSIPDFKKSKHGTFINCVIGSLSKVQEKKEESFALNKQTGHLEYGQIRFKPSVVNRFSLWQNIAVFMQVYAPQGQEVVQPEFLVAWGGNQTQSIPGELVKYSYDSKSKVWSGIYELNMFSVFIGENIFQVKVPLSADNTIFSRKIPFKKMQD